MTECIDRLGFLVYGCAIYEDGRLVAYGIASNVWLARRRARNIRKHGL